MRVPLTVGVAQMMARDIPSMHNGDSLILRAAGAGRRVSLPWCGCEENRHQRDTFFDIERGLYGH